MKENKIEQIREQLEKLMEEYKKDGSYFDMVDGYIPLENFIFQKLEEQRQSILEEVEQLSKEFETIDIRDILKKMR